MSVFENKRWIDLGLTYHEAAHAMQSGVALEHSRDNSDGSPKHLRVGVNSAMCDHGALVALLIKKGLISEAEYLEEIRLAMNHEVDRYQKDLARKYGILVTLR